MSDNISKKIAVVVDNFAWELIVKKLIEEKFIVDVYSRIDKYDQVSKIAGINEQFLFPEPLVAKDPKSLKKYSQALKDATANKGYDYVLATAHHIEFGCNIFHYNSIVNNLRKSPTLIQRIIFYLGHKARIDYYKNFYKEEHQITFVVSDILKDDFSENCNIPREKIVVAPPGHTVSLDVESYKKPYSPEKDKFIFGLSATGFSRKGGYLALRAMSAFVRKYPNSICKIIYPGYTENKIVKVGMFLLNLSGKVEFVGHQTEMSSFYNSINCMLVPSRHEAFGLVATEAMMHRTPVIVSSMTGAACVIKDGENGFIFDITKNAENNLVQKMEHVMLNYNNLDNCVENGFNTAKKLTWDNFVSIIAESFKG